MDPQAAWNELLLALADEDWPNVYEHALALSQWLDRAGFPLTVVASPPMGAPFNSALVRAACDFAFARHAEETETL